MSQDENKLQASESTNVIEDSKVKDTPQLSPEPANAVEKEHANVVETVIANAAEKDHKPQLSSENNVAVEISETNYDHRTQYTMNKTQIFLVFIGLSLAIFLASLDQTIIATALPAIALEFKALDQISWVGTAYLLTAKPVFLSAIFLFELGSLLCGLSVNMHVLLQVGGGLIGEIVPIKDRGKYQGMMGGCFGVASVVGPLLGGAFTDKVTWRWSFYINLPLGVITFISVVFLLHLPSPTSSIWSKLARIDWWGVITLISATILLLLPLNWGGSKYATTSGLELLPLILSIVIMAILSGQLVSRTVFFSYGAICVFGSILMIVGSGLVITFSEYSNRGQIAGYLLIAGFGIGLILQMTVLAGQGIAEPKDLAVVTSLLAFFRTMGAVFGVAILGTVFNNVYNSNLPPNQGSLQGFDPSATGQASPSVIHDFVIALDSAFKITNKMRAYYL
ncbi:24294_t:CDS:10 [Dentiscutata erythropus]|uniref:24294_t:CDS:1 n=1 Tax=Dentiscutata erythropus TaxID=1348616 RepID=A0A9N8VDF5_9GLOM|nr:24294_t:CDS:10 [Dentiscutata erythropus]